MYTDLIGTVLKGTVLIAVLVGLVLGAASYGLFDWVN